MTDQNKISVMAESHSFNVSIAMKHGIECATVLNHIAYWIAHNKRMNQNLHDNRYWTYQTRKQLAAAMPYFTEDQIRRYTDTLCNEGILVKGNYNKFAMDKTIWYAFADECIKENNIKDKEEIKNSLTKGESANSTDQFANSRSGKFASRNGQSAKAIPESKTQSLTKNLKNIVGTMPYDTEKKEKVYKSSDPDKYTKLLTPKQKELHDEIIAYVPKYGEPVQSDDVCGWFNSGKQIFDISRVRNAFEVYKQDENEYQIQNMGGYIRKAINERRRPKIDEFEFNKNHATELQKMYPQYIKIKKNYVNVEHRNYLTTVDFNNPYKDFFQMLEHAIEIAKHM
jgi:hypothetical protein